jgi:replicative DNA helicase
MTELFHDPPDPWATRQPGDDDGAPNPDDDLGELVPYGAIAAANSARTEARADLAAEELTAALPPSALDAERAVLGALLQGEAAAWEAVSDERLTPEDFYRPAHGTVFSVLRELFQRGAGVDAITVVDELLQMGRLDAVGGAAAISQLEAMLPTSAHARPYARLVREKALLRRAIAAATELVKQAYRHKPPVDVIHAALGALSELAADANAAHELKPVDRMEAADRLMRAGVDGKDPPGAIDTGWSPLTRMARGGPRPGQFIIIAARPGMGKTAFGHQLGEHMADAGRVVSFFSLEMSGDELIEREIQRAAGVTYEAWQHRQHSDAVARGAALSACRQRLRIFDTPNISLHDLTVAIRREVKREDSQAIIVDHVGLIKASNRYAGNRTMEVSEISSTLRGLAGELSVPVIGLCQLNRAVEARKIRRPMLSDLRDSGTLEQDAQMILMLYRPEYYLQQDGVYVPPELERLAEVIVAKNRGGMTGDLRFIFDGPTTKFLVPRGAE